MATFNKFQDYVEQLNKGIHIWSSHTFKIAMGNTAPAATDTVLADTAHLSTGGGYTGGAGGGLTLDSVTLTESAGTAKVTIADEVFTASGASVGPLRYSRIYNDSTTLPADAVVGWYDYGSSITLADGESYTHDFDGSGGVWTMA